MAEKPPDKPAEDTKGRPNSSDVADRAAESAHSANIASRFADAVADRDRRGAKEPRSHAALDAPHEAPTPGHDPLLKRVVVTGLLGVLVLAILVYSVRGK